MKQRMKYLKHSTCYTSQETKTKSVCPRNCLTSSLKSLKNKSTQIFDKHYLSSFKPLFSIYLYIKVSILKVFGPNNTI